MSILSLLYTDLTQVIDIKVVGDGAMEPQISLSKHCFVIFYLAYWEWKQ